MNSQNTAPANAAENEDEWNLPDIFDGITVEGGFDGENDEGCEGGACKI